MPAWTDINQLNGVTFGADQGDTLYRFAGNGLVESDNTITLSPRYKYGPGYYQNGYYYPGQLYQTYDFPEFYAAGTITVVDDAYIAPTSVGTLYVPPVFGVVEVSTINSAGTPVVQQLQIRGFGDQGIVFSPLRENEGDFEQASNVFNVLENGLLLSPRGFGPEGQTFPASFGYDPTAFDTSAICFAEGTRLATPAGLVAVEDLREGDAVLTAGGAVRQVRWIGHMVARPARHPRPLEVQPVRVTAHAFAPDVPAADVRLSPGHAVHVDGVLVPVHHLVNGATIVREQVERVRYFHVELDTHDVLLAEGLPCESYLDDGNRAAFANAGALARLHGRPDPASWADACAAMVTGGAALLAIRERLHARALELGWRCAAEPALRLLVNGADTAPVHAAGGRFWFALPATPAVTLCSRAGVPAQVTPAGMDRRQLGIAVAEVRVDGEPLPLDAAAFGAGFHAVERDGAQAWRWTDGAGVLSLEAGAPVMLEIAVTMSAPGWTRAAPRLAIVA